MSLRDENGEISYDLPIPFTSTAQPRSYKMGIVGKREVSGSAKVVLSEVLTLVGGPKGKAVAQAAKVLSLENSFVAGSFGRTKNFYPSRPLTHAVVDIEIFQKNLERSNISLFTEQLFYELAVALCGVHNDESLVRENSKGNSVIDLRLEAQHLLQTTSF